MQFVKKPVVKQSNCHAEQQPSVSMEEKDSVDFTNVPGLAANCAPSASAGKQWRHPLFGHNRYEGDGFFEGIFHYLWLKKGSDDAAEDPEIMEEFHVPQSVVYSCGRPHWWYFSSSKQRGIIRKHSQNLTKDNILRAIGKQKAVKTEFGRAFKVDVVARWAQKRGNKVAIEYLDRQGLEKFLDRKE